MQSIQVQVEEHLTAELICGNRKVPIIKLNGLKEINFGIWESQIQTEI